MRRGLEFGCMYEMHVPEPDDIDADRIVFNNVLDQSVHAEQHGYDSVWTVEHHFLKGWSHCSAPEVIYGALSQRTSSVRIGHAARLLPTPYNHPVRIAEMAATVDVLTGGRLDMGTARSLSYDEMNGFGIPPDETTPRFLEALRMLPAMWSDDTFSWNGDYFTVPERHVVPRPVQRPHPPLWGAATGPTTHDLMGDLGIGLMSLTIMLPVEEVASRIARYRDHIAACTDPVGRFKNDQAGVFTFAHCAETDELAREQAEAGVMHGMRSLLGLVLSTVIGSPALNPVGPEERDYTPGERYEYLREYMSMDLDQITWDFLIDNDLVLVGTPDRINAMCERYEDIGTDVLFLNNYLPGIPHLDVLHSYELMGREVIPNWKRDRPRSTQLLEEQQLIQAAPG
ncbi:MAG: LLM class flavin-dependent oxidoreductase [Acidimicrobiales bacterium]